MKNEIYDPHRHMTVKQSLCRESGFPNAGKGAFRMLGKVLSECAAHTLPSSRRGAGEIDQPKQVPQGCINSARCEASGKNIRKSKKTRWSKKQMFVNVQKRFGELVEQEK